MKPFTPQEASHLLKTLKGWAIENGSSREDLPVPELLRDHGVRERARWISHREDHPDLGVHYNKCRVEYWTHAIGGLSENDFICAAKADALVRNLKRVFSSYNQTAVYHARNLLENAGIEVVVKNAILLRHGGFRRRNAKPRSGC